MPEPKSPFVKKFLIAGSVVGAVVTISGATWGMASVFATKNELKSEVKMVAGLQYDQLLDYRWKDLQAELTEINARKRRGIELDTDTERKRFIIKEMDRIQKQQEQMRIK